MLEKISKAAIPVAASLGFAAAPTAAIGARVAGAAAGSVAAAPVPPRAAALRARAARDPESPEARARQ